MFSLKACSGDRKRGNVSDPKKPLAWLPFSIAEAALSEDAWQRRPGRRRGRTCWTGFAEPLRSWNPTRRAEIESISPRVCGICSCCLPRASMRCCGSIRIRSCAVQRTSTDDIVTWGMECPDCIYTRAVLRGGESYRLFGNRGTARYVGLQTMNGIVATANELVDELEVDADGNFEVVLSADERAGNWMRIEGDHPTLTVRHFFYDWDTEVASSLRIERLGDAAEAKTPVGRSGRGGVAATGRPRRLRSRTTWRSSCSSVRRRHRTASCRRSTAPTSARPRRTSR